jgi:hypothetical protein
MRVLKGGLGILRSSRCDEALSFEDRNDGLAWRQLSVELRDGLKSQSEQDHCVYGKIPHRREEEERMKISKSVV